MFTKHSLFAMTFFSPCLVCRPNGETLCQRELPWQLLPLPSHQPLPRGKGQAQSTKPAEAGADSTAKSQPSVSGKLQDSPFFTHGILHCLVVLHQSSDLYLPPPPGISFLCHSYDSPDWKEKASSTLTFYFHSFIHIAIGIPSPKVRGSESRFWLIKPQDFDLSIFSWVWKL